MKSSHAELKAFEIDNDSIYLNFELEDGNKIESCSYISLSTKTFEFLDKTREKITLNFDRKTVEVLGSDLKSLYASIGKHTVSVIRKAKGKDNSEPSVRDINVINPKNFLAAKD